MCVSLSLGPCYSVFIHLLRVYDNARCMMDERHGNLYSVTVTIVPFRRMALFSVTVDCIVSITHFTSLKSFSEHWILPLHYCNHKTNGEVLYIMWGRGVNGVPEVFWAELVEETLLRLLVRLLWFFLYFSRCRNGCVSNSTAIIELYSHGWLSSSVYHSYCSLSEQPANFCWWYYHNDG